MLSILSFILSYFINPQIILVLGCSNTNIQNQRLNTLYQYIDNTNLPIILYLSGGKKYPNINTLTEADIMFNQIHIKYPHLPIYIDRNATNTAQNFINFNKWIQNIPYNKVIINTSDFHKERSHKIFNLLIHNIIPEWILSISNCNSCWDSEILHMNNIHSDIQNSL